jgi:hypothetical protein
MKNIPPVLFSTFRTPASPAVTHKYTFSPSSICGTLAHTFLVSHQLAQLSCTNMPSAHPVYSEHWPTHSRCHTGWPNCHAQICPQPIQYIQNIGPHSLGVTLAVMSRPIRYTCGVIAHPHTLLHGLTQIPGHIGRLYSSEAIGPFNEFEVLWPPLCI